MEDQRNWTDASYKTYVRPLALPWPYTLAGRHASWSRRSRVTVEGRAAAAAAAGGGPAHGDDRRAGRRRAAARLRARAGGCRSDASPRPTTLRRGRAEPRRLPFRCAARPWPRRAARRWSRSARRSAPSRGWSSSSPRSTASQDEIAALGRAAAPTRLALRGRARLARLRPEIDAARQRLAARRRRSTRSTRRRAAPSPARASAAACSAISPS